jgi:hypothetical protein
MEGHGTAAARLRHPANIALYKNAPLGVRIANAVTGFMGSWRFTIIQTVIVALWVAGNVYLFFQLRPLSLRLPEPRLQHPGRIYRSAHPARHQPVGRAGSRHPPERSLRGGGGRPEGRRSAESPRARRGDSDRVDCLQGLIRLARTLALRERGWRSASGVIDAGQTASPTRAGLGWRLVPRHRRFG